MRPTGITSPYSPMNPMRGNFNPVMPGSIIYQPAVPTITCPFHLGEPVKRVCTYQNCQGKILVCSECVYEDPDHLKLHQNYIVPLMEFLSKLDEQSKIRKSKKIFEGSPSRNPNPSPIKQPQPINVPKDVAEYSMNDEFYLGQLRNTIDIEKKKIDADLGVLFNLTMENYKEMKARLFKELDDYFYSVRSYSDEFKKKVSDVISAKSFHEQYGPDSNSQIIYSKEIVTQKFYELKDPQLISDFLKQARDQVFNKNAAPGDAGKKNIIDSQQNSHFVNSRNLQLVENLKKMYLNPPVYKDTEQAQKVYKEILSSIPTLYNEYFKKFLAMVSFIFTEETKRINLDPIFLDCKSAQLDVKGKLSFSQPSVIPTNHAKSISCLTSVGEDKVATGACDSQIMIWDINTGEHISTFQGHKGPVVSMTTCWLKAQKPDEDGDPMSELYLASGSTDKNVILWNMNDENDTLALKGHDDCITCIMSLGDGRNLVTGSADRKVILWDIINGKIVTILPCNGSIYCLHMLKDEKRFVSSDYSLALNIWRLEHKRQEGQNLIENVSLEKVILTPSRITSLNSSYANPLLLIGGCEDKSLKIWNLEKEGNNTLISSDKSLDSHNGELADIILIERPESEKNREDFSILSISANDERIMIKDNRTGFATEFTTVLPKLKIGNLFSCHKMQLVKTSEDEYKIIVINQSETDRNLYIMTLQDSKTLNRKI